MRGNGTRFIVISFRSTLSEPSNRAELNAQTTVVSTWRLRSESLCDSAVNLSPQNTTTHSTQNYSWELTRPPTATTTVLWPLDCSICVSRHPQLRNGGLCRSKFYYPQGPARPNDTNWRIQVREKTLQQCYLHHRQITHKLHTEITKSCILHRLMHVPHK